MTRPQLQRVSSIIIIPKNEVRMRAFGDHAFFVPQERGVAKYRLLASWIGPFNSD